MKIKIDYITNSSSASFYILKKYLSPDQMYKIENHIEVAKKMIKNYGAHDDDAWSITEDEEFIKGYTIMDNFNMSSFLADIGVPDNMILWSD